MDNADSTNTTPDEMGPSNDPNSSSPERIAAQDDQMEQGDQDEAGDTDMGYIGSLQPGFDDFVSGMILMSVASSGRSYGRETRAAHLRDIRAAKSHG